LLGQELLCVGSQSNIQCALCPIENQGVAPLAVTAAQIIGSQQRVNYRMLHVRQIPLPVAGAAAQAVIVVGLVAAWRPIERDTILEQMALADFIAEGHFAWHLRRMRPLYQARRDALVEALRRELGDRLDIVVPQAGLNLAAWLPAGMHGQAVAGRIADQGLILPTLSQFSVRPLERDGWLFGFAGASPETLRAGIHALARTIRGRARSRGGWIVPAGDAGHAGVETV
jgi:hypothetical protein